MNKMFKYFKVNKSYSAPKKSSAKTVAVKKSGKKKCCG